jgi:hypothetical protein
MDIQITDDPPEYTREDMKELSNMSHDSSIAKIFLKKFDYDPQRFRTFLESRKLHKDVKYLFIMPLSDIPLLINKGEVHGYLTFRMTVGK